MLRGLFFIEVIVLVAALRRPRFFDKEIIYRGWRLIYQDSRSYFAETAYKSGKGIISWGNRLISATWRGFFGDLKFS